MENVVREGGRRTIRFYATGLVLIHLVVNLVHGSAHQQLHIDLSSTQMLFVIE